MNAPLVKAENLKQYYEVGGGMFKAPGVVKALDGASFTLNAGETLAIVGESGCGKSTLARLVSMIETPTEGTLEFNGQTADPKSVTHRKNVQIVFQNPFGSLNPRHKVQTILEEPLKLNTDLSAAERREQAAKTMERVGLRPEHIDRYPHMFSGGQRQRIAIARALMLNPDILVLDEPVSALDLSIQAQVLNLLAELQEELGLAYVFISHDLSVVRHIADEIMVMYLGRVVEQGPAAAVFAKPEHPYTAALISATPSADPASQKKRIILTGELPSPLNPPKGCAFNPRCPNVTDKCQAEAPILRIRDETSVACFNPVP
jgi:dipeptide transport system ATP-binding protein